MSAAVEVIRSKVLGNVAHGFLGRRGGVSTGVCEGLNVGLGTGDDRAAIQANRKLAVDAVAPGAQLVTVHQVHSARAVLAVGSWPDDERPQADALVTDRPGLALGILTADCAPILLVDEAAGVIGAAHAGWKGAHSGVVEATVDQMEELGAQRPRIQAAVGPCIARRSYEVSADFFSTLVAQDSQNERFFTPGVRADHFQFDLEGFVVARLAAAGVTRIEAMGLDTYGDATRFFSFRRATHAGEADYGRQISLIALPQ